MNNTGRPNTIKTKDSLYKNWVKPYLKADGSNLDEAILTWEAHLQPRTVKSVLYVAKEAVPGIDISSHLKRVARSKQDLPPTTLTKEEIVALSAVIKASDPLYLPFHIAINTGMRRGEIMGLRWEDIDMLKNRILVCRSYNGPTKSGKSRYIPISSALEKVIVAQPEFISYNCQRGKKRRKGNIIPATFDPNPPLRAACREAGIKEINFHALRHTFATLALDARRSPVLVSRVLGHANVATTMSLYWGATVDQLDMGFLPDA